MNCKLIVKPNPEFCFPEYYLCRQDCMISTNERSCDISLTQEQYLSYKKIIIDYQALQDFFNIYCQAKKDVELENTNKTEEYQETCFICSKKFKRFDEDSYLILPKEDTGFDDSILCSDCCKEYHKRWESEKNV